MKKIILFATIVGDVGIGEVDGVVTDIFYGEKNRPEQCVVEKTRILAEAEKQLREYFAGVRGVFDIPAEPERGTDFERAVWSALRTIPFGETRTYKQIAEQIGNPAACRAVGRANGRNRINIVVPCHRVIGAGGALTGYSAGVDIKEKLLRLEGVVQ